MKYCTIFTGGDPISEETLDKQSVENSYVIAADSGYVCAKRFGVRIDIVIGDFDSCDKPDEDNVEVFPVEKDDTDLMLAIKKAVSEGCDDITVYGATGGRLDHTIGNIQSLAYCLERGIACRIVSDNERAELLAPGHYSFDRMDGFSLSLFAYNSTVKGLEIKGTKYCGNGLTLTPGFPLGISNSVTAQKAEISFEEGCILCIRSRL